MSDIDPIVAEFMSRLGSDSATSLIREYSSRYPNLGNRLIEALEKAARDWDAKPWDQSQGDSLCIEFEKEFEKGLTPEIEPWLHRVPKSSQIALLRRLIASDVHQRTRRGEKIDWEAYKNRFPTLLASVEQAFEDFQPDQRQTPRSRDLGGVSTDIFIPAGGLGKLLVNRYRLDRLVGSGTFGIVYLAYDTVLNRQVAIKVRKSSGNSKQSNDDYLQEAQFAAGLHHPNIVKVLTVERIPSDELFIVSEYIEGGTLKDHVDAQDFDYPQIAKTILSVAEALDHAHQRGLIHRDIKPANILVEASSRNAFVVDFGLATREFEYLQRSDGAGSPAYKSPEQIRREGHKLDGRSDLFSLGIVFYELLTGKRPFVGSSNSETENRIRYAEPIPPNDHKSDIPAELERICMKLLRKEPNERHSSGAQVAEELRDWLAPKTIATPASTDEPAKVIPRGLRSYSDEDAGFFLDLLPGERDRQGLPESVAFWKKKIEQRDPEKTFGLGMLIGPSGSGKSSLVKAGIVPRLPSKIVSIHLDATAEDTEERLLQSLKKRFSGLQEVSTLTEAFSWIRTRIEPKVVLWLDQFEQWLSSGFDLKHSDLVDALRQCDGRTLQAVLMVRDDFYMASDRLMDALDVRLIKGENFMTVDLFDQEHAGKVLFTFGKAYGRIPSETEFPPSGDLKAFIDSAVGGLAEGGKVVSVRLALFAQMVKDKVWEPQTLEAFGGAQGVGVNFLEESFSARDANPQHRFHAAGAKEVLKALLPVAVSDLKGHRRSASELCEVAGYTSKPAEFQSLVKILDDDLRLITPSDEQGFEGVVSQRSYQLTHDYLVPSLREWLTRKQRETKKGRAELKLAERAATWGAKRENKQLPTLWEWFQIRRWTDTVKWNATERAAMQASDRYHTTRALLASTLAMALVLSGLGFKLWNDQRFMERDAANLVSKIETAEFGKLADELKKLPAMRAIVDPKLKAALEHTKDDSDEHLKLSLALVPSDPTQIDYLVRRLQSAQASQVQLIVDQLRPYKYKILDSLWSAIEGDNKAAWLPVAGALADYDPGNERWQRVAAKVSDNLVRDPLRLSIWMDVLRPAASKLNPELKRIYAATTDANRSQAQIDLATDILESYAANDCEILHELILSGKPEQFAKMFKKYEAFRKEALAKLREDVARAFVADSNASADETEASRLEWISSRANAAVALMRLEDPKPVYQFLTVDRDPEALSQFIYRIRGREVSPSLLVKSFEELATLPRPADPKERQQHYLRLYGMILGLGEFRPEQLPATERGDLIQKLSGMYGQHPSRAVHSALGWLLRRWGHEDSVRAIDETPLEYDPSGAREWYVMKIEPLADFSTILNAPRDTDRYAIDPIAPIYFTMLVLPGGKFEMGEVRETRTVEISGPIAVSDREVTWRQFSPIDGDSHRQSWEKQFKKDLGGRRLLPEEPVFGVSWLEAVNYCRWLTEARMPGEENQSYVMKLFTPEQKRRLGWLDLEDQKDWEWPMDPKKPGFRLLSESEWEYLARGGMETPYSFGTSEALLDEYGWYNKNTGGWSHLTAALRPSVAGLFDIHGNVWEWTDDWYGKGSDRVLRGGSWRNEAAFCRSANRAGDSPSDRSNDLGFRVALSPSGIPRSPEADK